jgi:hypothetical protein
MRIEWSLGDVVCVQIPRAEECEYALLFRQASEGRGLPLAPQSTDGSVEWNLSSDKIRVEIFEATKVVRIFLPASQFVLLAEALEEHILENGDYELDHSFETFGAEISPSHIKDVVFETV